MICFANNAVFEFLADRSVFDFAFFDSADLINHFDFFGFSVDCFISLFSKRVRVRTW